MAAQVINFSMNVDDVFNPYFLVCAYGNINGQYVTNARTGTWGTSAYPVTSNWISLDYGNGTVIAVSATSGTVGAVFTYDLGAWSPMVLPTSTTWAAVKYGKVSGVDYWVAISSAGNYAANSPDGCTWTARSISGTTRTWKWLAFGDGKFVAIDYASGSNNLRTAVSTDGGVNWTQYDSTITCPGTWARIEYNNGRFVALCEGSTVSAYSTDGINWTATTLPASTDWCDLAGNGAGVWIAISKSSVNYCARSSDNGATWSSVTLTGTYTWGCIAYGYTTLNEGTFLLLARGSTIGCLSIDNGLTWAAKLPSNNVTYCDMCYAPLKWFSGDTFTIANQSTLTVNTDQTQFWYVSTITAGKLRIENTSNENPVTFAMGRTSGSTAPSITPASGLGEIEIEGDWIEIGEGDGTSGQEMTAPYTDYIAAVWVETEEDSGVYEQWLNITGAYGDANPFMFEQFDAVSSGERGKFFVQGANAEPYGPKKVYTDSSVYQTKRGSRYLKVNSTAGLYPGAQPYGYPPLANAVINRILSSTEIEMNVAAIYPITPHWVRIAYGTSTWVAIAGGLSDQVAYSTDDGVNWTKATMPFLADWRDICYGATSGLFVAVARNSIMFATSPDGINWTARYSGTATALNWQGVASNGTSFVAVAATTADAVNTIGAYSADGITWVANTMPSAIWKTVTWCSITGYNRYVALANGTATAYDADGSGTWTSGTAIASVNWAKITGNSARLVAVGNNTTPRLSTDGGVTWTAGGALPSTSFVNIVWDGTEFVACASNVTTKVVHSTNGASWTSSTNPGWNDYFGIASDGAGKVMMVASSQGSSEFNGSVAIYSTDHGATWSDPSSGGWVLDTTLCFLNPLRSQLTDQITFGDGVNGNKVPTGAKVRVPNIMVTSLSPVNLVGTSQSTGASFVMSNGGILDVNCALFDECYHNLNQAASVSVIDAAFSIPLNIFECYDLTMTRVGYGLQAVRRYWSNPSWGTRDARFQTFPWNSAYYSYIDNAVITDFRFVVGMAAPAYGSSTTSWLIGLQTSDNVTINGFRAYVLAPVKGQHYALYLNTKVTNCTFNNIHAYGCGITNMTTASDGNTFDNLYFAPTMFTGKQGISLAGGQRTSINPATQTALVANTTYYMKTRSYRDWIDMTNYVDSPYLPVQPFQGGEWFLNRFACYYGSANTVGLTWQEVYPTAAAPMVYDIFRGTSPGFTRNAAARVAGSPIASSSTVTATDSTTSPDTTYYYVFRKYKCRLQGITNSSGSSGAYTITTSQNFNTLAQSWGYAFGFAGTRKIYLPPASGYGFHYGSQYYAKAGMTVYGATGIPTGAKVVSVDDEYQITIDQDITADFNQTLYMGIVPGMYVTGTGVGTLAKVVTIDSNTQITVDVANTGTVSGTLSFFDAEDSPEFEVWTGTKPTAANLMLYSDDFTNAAWTKTNLTTAAAAFYTPAQVGFNNATAPTARGVSLRATKAAAGNCEMVQTVSGLTAAVDYCLSFYIMAPATIFWNNLVNCTVTINTTSPTTDTFDATPKWTRISVPFTATGTSHTVTFKINDMGALVYACVFQINTGSTPNVPVTTTSAAVTLSPSNQGFGSMWSWCKASAFEEAHQGIEYGLQTAPADTHFTDIHLGTADDFTISNPSTRVDGSPIAGGFTVINISSSNFNEFTGLNQAVKGHNYLLVGMVYASNNSFKDFTFDYDWGYPPAFSIQNFSNENMFHNLDIPHFRNWFRNWSSSSFPMFMTLNNCSGNIIQCIRSSVGSSPIQFFHLDSIMKGVVGASFCPGSTYGYTQLGGGADGIAVASKAVYDNMFYETYFNSTKGAMIVIMNSSQKTSKPYTVLSGTPLFGMDGYLYFPTAGDSIEIEWPHWIRGVTGFVNRTPKFASNDLGVGALATNCLLIEFAINQGSGYGSYQELTGANLYATTITDPEIQGFKMKLRLTARAGMKHGILTNNFVVGETIRGVTSGATATVSANYPATSATGDIILTSISGEFSPGETIVRDSDSQARSVNVTTNGFPLFPSFNSYISGLQIYTTVDQTILYPSVLVDASLVLTNVVNGSEVHVYDQTTTNLLYSVESVTGNTFTYNYTWNDLDGDTTVYITVTKPGKKWIRYDNQTLGQGGLSIPVFQLDDPAYVE